MSTRRRADLQVGHVLECVLDVHHGDGVLLHQLLHQGLLGAEVQGGVGQLGACPAAAAEEKAGTAVAPH